MGYNLINPCTRDVGRTREEFVNHEPQANFRVFDFWIFFFRLSFFSLSLLFAAVINFLLVLFTVKKLLRKRHRDAGQFLAWSSQV